MKIAPSILAADFSILAEEIMRLEAAGADMLHIDVMDGQFVPNISIGPALIKSIRRLTKLPFDVHLMVKEPSELIAMLIDTGSDYITIHYEAVLHPDKILQQIKALGSKPGIALLPSTPPSVLEYLLDKLDLILVMAVNPGFCGQKFIRSQLIKIQQIKQLLVKSRSENILLAVDGGINATNALECAEAGAGMLVAGSYILSSPDYRQAINSLKG